MSVTERELRLLRVVQHVTSAWQAGTIPRQVRFEPRTGGNPYHDADGKFTTGPGGAGGRPNRKRRKGRKRASLRRKREAIRKEYKAWARQLKREHRASHRDAVKDYRKAVSTARKDYARERRAAIREGRKGIAAGKTAGERNEAREFTRIRLDQAKDQYRADRKSARDEFKGELASQKEFRREEWAEFRDRLRSDVDDLRDEFGLAEKARGVGEGLERALPTGRIHKAGSAESILRHCLRARGWTRAYRAGTLSGRKHLQLLDDVRQYGRAWLRHEAEQFARQYLGTDGPGPRGIGPDVLLDAQREAVATEPEDISRELVWNPAPGGYLVATDTGLRANIGRFFRRAKNFVRELIVAGTMALSGPAPLTGEELEAAEKEAIRQEQFFDKFEGEVLANPPAAKIADRPTQAPTPPQFIARVEKYANTSWQAAQRINRVAAIRAGVFTMERRVLGRPKTEHCEDCPPLAARGWSPIGSLPQIGESECGPLCLCHFEYTDKDGGKPYVQGKKGPLPAPSPASGDVEMVADDDDGVQMVAEPPR